MFKRMAGFRPDSGGRVTGVTVVTPIVYGNVARYFGQKREEDGHTHQRTVYIKPYRNEGGMEKPLSEPRSQYIRGCGV